MEKLIVQDKASKRMLLGTLFVVVNTCLTAQAQVVPVPPDLNVGDEYRLLFVTNSLTDALSADIAVYNVLVAAEAAAVPQLDALGTIWTAVASTPTVDARINTMTDPAPPGPTGVPHLSLERHEIRRRLRFVVDFRWPACRR